MTNPKVSIIVPVYNVEKYLPCCIDSLLNQALKDIEIIMVDDESSDNCPAICDEYAKQDHRVRVIHKKNEGQGIARNSGLEIATGKYIAFVDSDDYVEPITYQRLYTMATETKADVIYFTYQRFNDQGNIWGKTSRSEEIRYQTEEDIREVMLDMIGNPPKAKMDQDIQNSACCALYRYDKIKRYGLGFRTEKGSISEDLLFNLDYLLHSSNIITIPDAFYYYRVNPLSFTRAIRKDRIDICYFFYKYLLDLLEKNNFGKDGYLRATRFFIGNSRAYIRQYIQSSLSKMEKMQWLKAVINHDYWKEIASSYPYQQLPLMYALHFYLLHKGFLRLLYYYSKLGKSDKPKI